MELDLNLAGLAPSPFQFNHLDLFVPPTENSVGSAEVMTVDTNDFILNKKRKRLPTDKVNCKEETETAPSSPNADNKRRKAPGQKKELFQRWLRQRQKGKVNPVLDQEIQALNPEDLYGHFLDFLPEDLEAFDEEIRFERTCAEDALQQGASFSWLLRRSSYNRHWRGRLMIGCPPPEPTFDQGYDEEEEEKEAVDIDPDAQLQPTFFAFSYKRDKSLLQEGQREIGHLLIVYTQLHGWALAEEDKKPLKGGGTKIFCRHFFPSFISLLAHTLERVGVHPLRMIAYEVHRPTKKQVEGEKEA